MLTVGTIKKSALGMYSRLLIIRTFKGNRKRFELSTVKYYYIENDLKGNENWFKLGGGSSYRGFKLPGVNCIIIIKWHFSKP